MIQLRLLIIAAAFIMSGCSQGVAPADSAGAESEFVDSTKSDGSGGLFENAVAWDDLKAESGGIFQHELDFVRYVRGAEIIGAGILSDWDGQTGLVKVKAVYRGDVNGTELPLIATGGLNFHVNSTVTLCRNLL